MGYTGHVETIKQNQQYRLVVNTGKDPVTNTYKKLRKKVNCGGKREADELLRQWISELEKPTKKLSDQLLGEYLNYWVDTIAKKKLEQNTYESYKHEIIERHLIPNIGHVPLSELVPLHIQTLYSYKSEAGKLKPKDENKPEGLSNRTVKYIHSVLHQALAKAVDLELIEKNPCEKIKPPKSKKQQKEKMTVLSKDELKNFLNDIREHQDYAEIFVAAYTGMRISELLGLRWSDIHFKDKKINIEMTMHQLKNGDFEHRARTKNKTSTRIIAVTDNVLEVLKKHKEQLMADGILAKNKNKHNLVFPEKDGNPQNRKNLSKRFHNIAFKMGYKGMRFHDLRHTHATILLEAGEMVNAVSERLGHSNINTTLQIYGHVRPKKAVDTAEKFDQLINS